MAASVFRRLQNEINEEPAEPMETRFDNKDQFDQVDQDRKAKMMQKARQ